MTMNAGTGGAMVVNLLAYKAERAKRRAQATASSVSPLVRSAWRSPTSRQIAHRRQMLENLGRAAGCGQRSAGDSLRSS
jgi:hypothetical protein